MKKTLIRNILIPIDFSEASQRAIVEGARLANLLDAELYLMHVLETHPQFYSRISSIDAMDFTPQDIRTVAENEMGKIRKYIERKFEIVAKLSISSGHIFSEIMHYSLRKGIDLIVMGAHGHSGYKEWLIGSNAQSVVTHSLIPVLTLQSSFHKSGFKRILLPIDNSIHSREKVGIATLIAELFDAEIHIIGLPDSREPVELNKFYTKIESVEDYIRADDLSYNTTILEGKNLATVAIDYATRKNCDLIVINSGHESRLTQIFLGAFAEHIVNHSKVPILSLKHSREFYTIETPGFGV